MVAVSPNVSSHSIASDLSISQSSVIKILHKHKFHPYKLQQTQQFSNDDFDGQIEFYQWALGQYDQNNDFSRNIFKGSKFLKFSVIGATQILIGWRLKTMKLRDAKKVMV